MDGNNLQTYVEEEYLNPATAVHFYEMKPYRLAYSCSWKGCGKRTPFSDKSKLARYIRIHKM